MKVSIIITCFNRQNYISRSIRSALSQHFIRDDYEIIVVDDGSTDNSPKIIQDFEPEIRPILLEKNAGLPAARNIGIRKSKGRFIVHLDSDDYIHSDLIYVEEMHLALNADWGAVACDYVEVNENEEHIVRRTAESHPIACGIMFRKENLINIGLYDEQLLLCEDEDLRRRYEEQYRIGYVHLPLYRYRKHDGNITNNKAEMEKYKDLMENKYKSDL